MVRVTTIASAPHELRGNVIFVENGFSPYWVAGSSLIIGFDGYGTTGVTVDGKVRWGAHVVGSPP